MRKFLLLLLTGCAFAQNTGSTIDRATILDFHSQTVVSNPPSNTGRMYYDNTQGLFVCLTPSGANACPGGGGGGGGVSTVTSGNLAPLFTVSIANASSTPAFSFTFQNFAANAVLANCTGSTAAPTACAITTAMLPFTYTGSTTKLATAGTFTGAAGTSVCLDASTNLTTTGCTPPGSGNITGTSMTLGLPVVATASTTQVSSASYIDVSQFSGADMCAKVAAAISAQSGAAKTYDARAITGNQVCSAANATTMLFGATNGGQLLLGNVSLYVDGAANFSDGAGSGVGTPAIILPNKFNGIYGVGRGTGGVATTISVCTGTNTPVTGCTTAFPARSFSVGTTTVVGNVMTINATGLTSSTVFTVGGGEYAQLRGSSATAENAMYKVLSVGTNLVTVTVPTGTAACAASCGTLWLGTAVIGLAEPATAPYYNQACGTACNSFGEHLKNLSIDGQYVLGLIGVQNLYANEESGVDTVLISKYSFLGLDVHTNQSQNGGPYENMEIYTGNAGTNCDYGTTAAAMGDTPDKGIRKFTFNSNVNCAVGVAYNGVNHPRSGILMDKSNDPIRDGHTEGFFDAVTIGANAITQGASVQNVYCGTAANTNVNCVHISANYGTGSPRTSDDMLTNIRRVAGTTTPFQQNTVLDDINSIALADAYVAMYSEDFNSSLVQTGLLSSNPAITNILGSVQLLNMAGAGVQCVQTDATGKLTGTGAVCGAGGGGGSGTVSAGTTSQMGYYAAAGTTIGPNPVATLDVSGNLVVNNATVNGTLSTAGPLVFTGGWPGSTPTVGAASTTVWGVDAGGAIGASINGGAFNDFLTTATGMTNPMTTANDLIVGGSAGAPTRLAKTNDSYLVTNASGVPSWKASPIVAGTNITISGTPSTGITINASGTLGTAVNNLTAATGTNTVANGNFPQTWNCALTTNSTNCLNFGETTAATATGSSIVSLSNLATSTAVPLTVNGVSTTPDIFDVNVSGVTKFSVDHNGNAIVGNNVEVANGGNVEGTAGTANVTFQGGQPATAGTATQGGAFFIGGSSTSANSGIKGGYAVLGGGGSSNAAPGAYTPGATQLQIYQLEGTVNAVGDVVCASGATNTVTDCSKTGPQSNIIGIAATATNPIVVVMEGTMVVGLSNTGVLGHTVCMGTSADGLAVDSGNTLPCTAGIGIGVIMDVTTSRTLNITAGAASQTVTLSTSLPMVALHFR